MSFNQTFNAENSFYKNNWFARQQPRRNHPTMVLSGILMRLEHMFDILFFGLFPHLFLYTVEIGQIAFVIAAILFAVSIVVKIIKNQKAKKNLS